MKANWDEVTGTFDVAVVEVPENGRQLACLTVMSGLNVGEVFRLSPSSAIVIGRSQAADIRLLDDGISRAHARIQSHYGGYRVVDLGSRNGTFVNGKKVAEWHLQDGDKVHIGRQTILAFRFQDEVEESFQRQMYDSALRDSLTQSFNKRYFVNRLESEFRFAQRHQTPLSLLLMDLDHFKRINDQHGHIAGDHVLRTFASQVSHSVRNEDVFARYGGEEFAIISRSLDLDKAVHLGERLRELVASLDIQFDHKPIPITVSVGVAALPRLKVDRAIDLLSAADRALYRAKKSGRNRVSVVTKIAGPEKDTLVT